MVGNKFRVWVLTEYLRTINEQVSSQVLSTPENSLSDETVPSPITRAKQENLTAHICGGHSMSLSNQSPSA